jgi:glycosyltransferase involved in cell wall biosynthesis
MGSFEVLCVTMGQTDFCLFKKMNIHSDVLWANQCGRMDYQETIIDGYKARMVSTNTRGVGINRNIACMYSSADICLLSDDDMIYDNDYEKKILEEFENNPKADAIIFNIGTSTPEYGRIPTQTHKRKYLKFWSRKPYGAPRIAFRRYAIQKHSIMFSTLFGGGCTFLFGEDTLWIEQLLSCGLNILLSPVHIGDVSYANTTTFTDDEEKRLYSLGAMIEAGPKLLKPVYELYYSYMKKYQHLSSCSAYRVLKAGEKGFVNHISYANYKENE